METFKIDRYMPPHWIDLIAALLRIDT